MKLDQILVDSFGAQNDQLIDSFVIADFPEWDSMSYMLFITKLEEAYGIEISGNEIMVMNTVGDIKKMLLNKGK